MSWLGRQSSERHRVLREVTCYCLLILIYIQYMNVKDYCEIVERTAKCRLHDVAKKTEFEEGLVN